MKKYILAMILLMVLTLGGCSAESEPLRLGSMPTYSAAIYAVGIEQGFFKDAGIEVDLTIFRSARDRDAAATAGELDGLMTDIMGAINLNAKDFSFIMTSREFEVFGVMNAGGFEADPNSIPTMGISENTVIEYIVDTYVEDEVAKVNIAALPDRMGALLGGELDYGVFPNPFVGIIMGSGGEMAVNTVAEDFHPVVVIFSEDYHESDDRSIQAFYDGYKETIEYMNETAYDEYKEALVIHGLATEENVDLFRLPVDQFDLNPVDEVTYDSIHTWMLDKELVDVEIKFESIYTSQFID